MLNEERIKLMTRMASYAEEDGKKNRNVADHFRGDYVAVEVIKAIISATLAFMVVFAMYIYYNFETLMVDIYHIDLFEFGGKIVKYYGLFTVCYCVLVYIGFSIKYSKARKNLRRYFNNLKRLGVLYNKEKMLEMGDKK